MKASEFLATIRGQSASAARDAKVVEAARAGGLVEWPWVEVPLKNGRGAFRVASDYVSIGEHYPTRKSNRGDDWVRVPMGGAAAQSIADLVGAVLPSGYMVDLIWDAAELKLRPITFPTAGMMTTEKFVEHHRRIEEQRGGRDGLVAGIKKDTVVTNKLLKKPQATAIYGWHHPDGKPIQPVSTAHGEPWYSDYSHGVRLVAPEMVLDGRTVLVQDVLRDPSLAAVLTGGAAWGARHDAPNDGVLQVVRYGSQPRAPEVAQVMPVASSTPSSGRDLGVAAVEWCLAELAAGVREEPPGSNTSPRIREYLAPARRRETGKLVGLTAGEWCAAGQSAALAAVARPGEYVPHGYRIAVWELREDAKATGAWVPIADVRAGRYRIQRGDLLVSTRGAPGLGHVARVDVPPNDHGEVVTIGANENNAWTRRTRNLSEPELEGVIKYRDYRPVMTLDAPAPANVAARPAPAPSTPSPAPGQSIDAWARGVFLQAWEKEFPGTQPTAQEFQGIMAIARYERMYGHAAKPEAGRGANNWGGVQCPSRAPCKEGCYPGGDKDKAGQGYAACFKKYDTPLDGARHLIQLVTRRRPHVHAALRSGDLLRVGTEMGTKRTIDGKDYLAYHETDPPVYGRNIFHHAKELAKALGQPLAVRLGETTASSSASVTDPPAAVRPVAPTTTPASSSSSNASSMQAGIRAIVASRAPTLARVVVGAPIAPCELAPAVTTGVASSLSVRDYAERVNDYIRALHAIIEEERKIRQQPDGFPWNEWAAFRVSWSEAYFQVSHALIPWFDDSVVKTYDGLSRKWADVVQKHYGRRPATPLLDPPSPIPKAVWYALGGSLAVGLLTRFVMR
ncbi:hypothetical protein [Polyangium sp. 15x6]|uniref:hypothetical protein n=1 Tax=Polyangium sp. 15x6 TaxID=3042687 RepID=UPI00249BFA20|nr:hypothetical protein [Polyangium sp. 15x6]MDI3285167.1 hypothetical protein [Polyangium sp. 15x6]